MTDPEGPVTRILARLAGGDPNAGRELLPLVYEELLRAARGCMRGQAADHTLQPTALVHEAWLRLFGDDAPAAWNDRAHFLAVAARAMRHVLVDHARAGAARKRGDGAAQLALDQVTASIEERGAELVLLHEALEELERHDPELGRIVELRFFAGLTVPETAQVLGLSTATAERRWRVARMLLRERLPGTE